MSQPLREAVTYQRRQQEILHSIKGGWLVEAALVVIMVTEGVLGAECWGDRQRFRSRSLMDTGG